MTRRAEIIATGSELLSGVQETNSSFIAERLTLLGIDLISISIIRDDQKEISDTLRKALDNSDLIIITGGLGPTEDDLTRKVVAKVLNKRLILDEVILERIKTYFKQRNNEMPRGHHRQALIPFGAKAISNPIGTASGFYIEHQNRLILCLPGPHREMKTMLLSIEPTLSDKYRGRGLRRLMVLRTCGINESWISEALKDVLNLRDGVVDVGLAPSESGIDIRIMGTGLKEDVLTSMKTVEEKIRERLGYYIYGTGEESLELITGRLLREKGIKISIAESFSGGIIAHRITNIPGSSDYLERGVVCYSNRSKIDILNVPARLIEEYGSVSKEVAVSMAEGIRSISLTDLGLSTTGIAGPTGGHEGKPIGLVYIALAKPNGTECKEYRFISDREGIKIQASQMALDILRRYLLN